MKVVYVKFVRNKPFYVGEGSPEREQKPSARNKVWKDSIGDADHVCSLVVSTHSDKVGSKLQEQGLIRWFGQRILGEGPLTNILPWGDVGDHKSGSGGSHLGGSSKGGKGNVGLKWWNDGTNEQKARECPGKNWTRGRAPKLGKAVSAWRTGRTFRPKTDETRRKQSESKTGQKWWTNGSEETCCRECPGPSWTRGRCRTREKKS